MILDPAGGWSRAAESARNIVRLVLLHLFPLLLLGCVAEGYGMLRWGKRAGKFGSIKYFSMAEVIPYQAWQFVLGLLVVILGAVAMRHLGNTFHVRQSFKQGLAVSVFGLGPVFLMRVFDAFPGCHPWVPWIIGAAVTMAILYQGIPRVMRLDPADALGVYMASMLVLVFVSGLARLVVIYSLREKLLGLPTEF